LALAYINKLPDGVYHVKNGDGISDIHHLIAIKENNKWNIFDFAGG
jgi:hypothetical protein